MEQKQKDYEANLRAVRDFFRTLPEKTDIAVLPEMWTTGFMTTKEELDRELIEEAFQKGREAMKALASEYGTAVYGSLIEPLVNGKLSNSAFFVDESGKEIGYYPKHQLFGPGGEKKYFSAGDRRVQIAYKDFQIRLAVCYDLRFPIWLRQDRSLGLYDLLLFCANWPEPRQEHWQTLSLKPAPSKTKLSWPPRTESEKIPPDCIIPGSLPYMMRGGLLLPSETPPVPAGSPPRFPLTSLLPPANLSLSSTLSILSHYEFSSAYVDG